MASVRAMFGAVPRSVVVKRDEPTILAEVKKEGDTMVDIQGSDYVLDTKNNFLYEPKMAKVGKEYKRRGAVFQRVEGKEEYVVHFMDYTERGNVVVPGRGQFVGIYNPGDELNPIIFPKDTGEMTFVKGTEPKPEESKEVKKDRLVVGVPRDAPLTREILREAYHKRALAYHPDRNPGKDTTKAFQAVQQAYDRLVLVASE